MIMPRKKKKRVCAHCGVIITRRIKRVEKDIPIFCVIDHAIAYHTAGNQVEPEKKKKQQSSQQQTTLVAVKDIKRTNPTWYDDPLFVYIGNRVDFHPMKQSRFYNPFRVTKIGRRKSIDRFEKQFYQKIRTNPAFKEAVEGLRGKILVCWCSPSSCHGDVIINYLHKPKTLEDYREKVKDAPQEGLDTTKTALIFNLIRLYEIQQDQFTYQDRLEGVEGTCSRYIMPDYLATQSGYSMGLVQGCLLALNRVQNKVYWDGMYIESKDHYIQRNFTDYKGRVRITRQNQRMIYHLFGGRPQEVTDREIIRSR